MKIFVGLLLCLCVAIGAGSVIRLDEVVNDNGDITEKLWHVHVHFHHGRHHVHIHYHHGHIHVHYHYHHHHPPEGVIAVDSTAEESRQGNELEGNEKVHMNDFKPPEEKKEPVLFALVPLKGDRYLFTAAQERTDIFAEDVDPAESPEVCGFLDGDLYCARLENFETTPTGYKACVTETEPTHDADAKECFEAKFRKNGKSGEMSFVWA